MTEQTETLEYYPLAIATWYELEAHMRHWHRWTEFVMRDAGLPLLKMWHRQTHEIDAETPHRRRADATPHQHKEGYG